jgi:hypothetical protein
MNRKSRRFNRQNEVATAKAPEASKQRETTPSLIWMMQFRRKFAKATAYNLGDQSKNIDKNQFKTE